MSDLLDHIARAAHARAVDLGAKAGLLLFECSDPAPAEVQWTQYDGGKFDTTNGKPRCEPFAALGDEMAAYAKRVVRKGEGRWIAMATSSNGRCRDADVTGITGLPLDCDGHGDWTAIRAAFDEARIGYIVQRSSSSTPELPKWHLTPPLSRPWIGPKAHWRCMWRWIVGFFAGVAQLRVRFEGETPSYGFDHTTDRLAQPIFLSAKRHRSQEPPETIYVDGLALDLEEFLTRSGFDRSWLEQPATYEPAAADARALAPASGLLALAFAESGMLSDKRIERVGEKGMLRGFAAECPREHTHSTGRRFDGSTMIVDPGPGQTQGFFICLHRCGRMKASEALKLLPEEAVARARDRWAAACRSADVDSEPVRYTELGNSVRLAEQFKDWIRFCRALGWLVWDGRRWKQDTTGAIVRYAKLVVRELWAEAAACSDADRREALLDHARKSEKAAAIAAMIKLAESAEGIAVEISAFDADPWILNCRNGILDLRTFSRRPHDPGAMCTKLAPVDYDPNARAPRFVQFMREVLPDATVQTFVQRFAGYGLTGVIRERVLVLFVGKGRNGKSVLIRILVRMLGDYAMYAAPDLLMDDERASRHPTELADLCGVRFAAMSETKKHRRFDEERLKRLTGNEPIKARFMYRDLFQFEMQAKLGLACNHRPRVVDRTDSIWDRLREVPFSVRIADDKEDRGLFEKLSDELPGILAWAVEGCRQWQQSGLGTADAVEKATQAYRDASDPFAPFFADEVVFGKTTDPTFTVTRKALRAAYLAWLEHNDGKPSSSQELTEAMVAKGCEEGKRAGERFWRGARLRDLQDAVADEAKKNPSAPAQNGSANREKTAQGHLGHLGQQNPESSPYTHTRNDFLETSAPSAPSAPDVDYDALERAALESEEAAE